MTRARDDKKKNARLNYTLAMNPAYNCPNCDEPGRHYIIPSMGEPGYYACDLIKRVVNSDG